MPHTFKHYLTSHLELKRFEFQTSTFKSYKSKADYLARYFGRKHLKNVNHLAMQKLIAHLHEKYNNKTINEYFTVLRAVFNGAVANSEIPSNPMASFDNLTTSDAEPTPFCREELASIYQAPVSCESGKSLLLLGTLTGLRISELLALTWESIHFDRKVLQVQFANVEGELKVPKTKGSVRVVELTSQALTLLTEQHKRTGHFKPSELMVTQADVKSCKRYQHRYVFINSKTNAPFLHSKQYQKSFYDGFLNELGIRHRGPNQARHTFASQALTAGINKQWIANCLGHRNTEMVERHYARWIKPDALDFCSQFEAQMQAVFETPQPAESMSENVIHFPCGDMTLNSKSKVSRQSQAPKIDACDELAWLQDNSNPLRSHCTFSSKKMQYELRAREGSLDSLSTSPIGGCAS